MFDPGGRKGSADHGEDIARTRRAAHGRHGGLFTSKSRGREKVGKAEKRRENFEMFTKK